MEYEHIVHPFPPLFDENSEILILGSLPSVKSREQMFFYGHPQNRFWRVIAAITENDIPVTIEDKKKLLISSGIALWDVIAECEITGSADSSIKNAVANDLTIILNNADIKRIFVNGKTAEKYYNKYIRDTLGREAVCLPSTSPLRMRRGQLKCLSQNGKDRYTEHKEITLNCFFRSCS